MKLPVSLMWRTLGVLIVAIVASQAVSLYLLSEHVTKPRTAQGIGQFVSHLKTIRAALETLPPEQHAAFIAKIAEKEGLRVLPVTGAERARPAPGIPQIAFFRERIRAIFGPEAEVYVRPMNPQALWIRIPTSGRDYWIAFPRGRIDRNPTEALIGWGVAGIAIALAAAILIAWWLGRPLQVLAEAAARLGRGEDPPAVAETGPSELRGLARAFNRMKDDLKRQERERATFLAGISHDLRTPLARLRLETEMLGGAVPAETQRNIVADIDDMNAVIDQFIDFARSEATEPLAPVNLAQIATGAAERAARGGAAIQCDPGATPVVMLRPLAIQRLLDNLIGNAVKHGGGDVFLRTASTPHGVRVSVLDRGPGIPAELVAKLKEPFTRADDARSGQSGAGLGLANANRIAAMHGGTLKLLPRDGGGLEARVDFPASS